MIHVLIERHIAADMLSTYEALSRSGLQQTYSVPGFISGETFANVDDDHHRFVLGRWKTQNDWHRWYQSTERIDIMNKINPVLTGPEKILLLEN